MKAYVNTECTSWWLLPLAAKPLLTSPILQYNSCCELKKRNFTGDQQKEEIWISTEYTDCKKNYWSITLNCRAMPLLELALRKAHTHGDTHNHLGRGQVGTTLRVPAGPGNLSRGLISPLCCLGPALPFLGQVLSAPGTAAALQAPWDGQDRGQGGSPALSGRHHCASHYVGSAFLLVPLQAAFRGKHLEMWKAAH